jgi:hypothetical protein
VRATKSIPQPEAAENGSDRIVRVTGGHGGGGKRDMSVCLFSLRNGGTYTAIFPHQELLDKGWKNVVVDAVFKGDVLEEYRIRETQPGENGAALRNGPRERPRYEIPNVSVIVAASRRRRYLVEQSSFDQDGNCCIRVPLEWRSKAT